jgi:hypothetical protein
MTRGRGLSVVLVGLFVVGSSLSVGATARRHAASRPEWFTDDFRSSRYLQLASDLQALPPDARIRRLRDLARDPDRSTEIFPLCRMLFQAKGGQAFRRPGLGGPVFVGTSGGWPLEPIDLFEEVPILVVRGYGLGGLAEPATMYLDHCLKSCRWSDLKYVPRSASVLKAIVESFIAAHPEVATDVDWLRQQAQ